MCVLGRSGLLIYLLEEGTILSLTFTPQMPCQVYEFTDGFLIVCMCVCMGRDHFRFLGLAFLRQKSLPLITPLLPISNLWHPYLLNAFNLPCIALSSSLWL